MPDWRLGFEVELLAPAGKSRLDLAEAIARDCGGSVRRFFHPQSEPSLVPGTPVFHSLTLGFEVFTAEQEWVVRCVDDLTLQSDLQRNAPPQPGWYRILSDDERLLRLVQQQADPQSPVSEVLDPIAALFGTIPTPGAGGMFRVNDRAGASIAIAAALPGERERPCELITAPLDPAHHHQLERWLKVARELGFSAPLEGATHIHFDATAIQSAATLAHLVQLLSTYGQTLKELMGTNPHCRRLGPWPAELLETVSQPDFSQLSWREAQSRLQPLPLSKYCDFNLLNCILDRPDQNTLEVRILPVFLESQPILEAADLFVALLRRAQGQPISRALPPGRAGLLQLLSLAPEQQTGP
jgi:hypothetical protein